MTESFKKYDNLSENELNTKSNKDVYVRNDVIGSVIVHSTGEKRKKSKKNRWIQKKNQRLQNLRFHSVQNTQSNQKQRKYL